MMPTIPTLKAVLLAVFAIVLAGNGTSQAETGPGSNVDRGVIFKDDFSGTILRPEWAIKNQDSDRWALVDGDYLIIITGPLSDGGSINTFVYTGELPHNYDMVVKMSVNLHYLDSRNYNGVFVGIERDIDNRIYLEARGDGRIVFDKLLKGESSMLARDIGDVSGDIFLRIVKQGVEFEGTYSFDGSTWTSMGNQFFINLNGKPVLGGYNTTSRVADTGVQIDYVEITAR